MTISNKDPMVERMTQDFELACFNAMQHEDGCNKKTREGKPKGRCFGHCMVDSHAENAANIFRTTLLRFKEEVEGEMAEGVIDDLDSIIDFVSGTDSEITEYVKEMKSQYRTLLSK